ncbi:MAG TPA: amidohydrolase family protein [Candidatus Limnocylindrales bacterium]|nr:amidohydrolase family protein [Candidatus Limnocylindrales bacterium]
MEVLIDGHCHSILAGDLDRAGFELACNEADRPPPDGLSYLDSQVGLAIRRWCAPALGLPPHAGIDDYLHQRRLLGWQQVSSTLLHSAGLTALLVDTGLDGLLDVEALGEAAGATVHEVVRLEQVAEQLAGTVDANTFASVFEETLDRRVRGAIAVKSILAYRYGLKIPSTRPSPAEVREAAGRWLRAGGRLTDPVLLRHILWAGVDTGLPVQLHTGFGDRDLRLPAADPALLQPFLASAEPTGVPIVLLHCYPYHRQAGWLAQVFPHVYVDVGLTVTHLGARSVRVLAEFFELAPFGKLLFSTDAYLLPELFLVGAAQFRLSLRRVLDEWRSDDAISITDAERIAEQVCAGNAQRIYRL